MITLKHDFKTIQIALYLIDQDDRKYTTYRYLLPRLMTASTDHYPTRQLMSQACENLYGAYFKVRTERMGNLSVMSFVLTVVDPKIVKDPTLFEQALRLFDDVMHHHKAFSSDVFSDEKRMLIEHWKTLKDNKRGYASHRFQSLFFDKDLYGYPISGSLHAIQSLKKEDMEAYYRDFIHHQARYVVINGHTEDLDLSKVEEVLGPTTEMIHPFKTAFRAPRQKEMVIDYTDMQQAIVKMGFIFPIYRRDQLYDAAVIVDTIIGGYPESRLFKVIREERGLCYDISSSYDYYKGVLLISSGIDLSQVDQAVVAIENLIKNLQDEGITDEELSHAKAYYMHQVKSSLDQQSVLTRRAFVRDMLHYVETVEEKLIKIEAITKEDVNQALKHLTCDTIYILRGEKHD